MKQTGFLAIDLGASSGRVIHARIDGAGVRLDELHRFPNGGRQVLGTLYWDVLGIWEEVKRGIRAYAQGVGEPVAGIGVATWGVDFGLLDERGRLLANPVNYRDRRTDGMPERLFERIPRRRVYEATGIQVMQINTLFQLYSMTEAADPLLGCAHELLMLPDLFAYWLSGRRASERTIASTSQMLAPTGGWAVELLEEAGLPTDILPDVVAPGTVLGELDPGVARELGMDPATPIVASAGHDTASAVAGISGLEGCAFISSGTWSLVGAEQPAPILSEFALERNFTNEAGVEGTFRFLKNVAGLWLLQECKRQWSREGRNYDWEELILAAREARPFRSLVDAGAETFLKPGDMHEEIRAFCRRTGQPEPTTPGEVTRCCLESLALSYRLVIEDLERATARTFEGIRVVGGGSRNELLNHFTANACSLPVLAGPVEATALGNTITQAAGVGALSGIAEGRDLINRTEVPIRYEPSDVAAWQEALRRYRELAGS